MIKKWISLLLLLVLTVTCACSCSAPQKEESDEPLNERESILEELLLEAQQDPSSHARGTHVRVMYTTFEECLSTATHIVSATYTGEYETNGIYKDLVFVVEDQYKGAALADEFHLRVWDADITVEGGNFSYSQSAEDYKAGTTYLLVLQKHASKDLPYDHYLSPGNIMITNDYALMYGGGDIQNHSTELKDSSWDGIVDYIKNYVKESVPSAAQQ